MFTQCARYRDDRKVSKFSPGPCKLLAVSTLAVVTMAFVFPVRSQSILASRYPLGVSLNAASGPAASMGGTAVAVRNEFNVLLANPANLGSIEKTVFSALLTSDFLNIRQGSSRATFTSIIPEQITFAFWLGSAGTLGFGIESRTDLRTKYRSVAGISSGITDRVEMAYSANGGLTTYHAGWGYNLLDYLTLGIGYERFYFTTDQTSFQSGISGTGFPPTRDSLFVRARGNAFRGGIQVPVWRLVGGLTGEYFFPTEADVVDGIFWGEDSQEDVDRDDLTLQIPPSLAFGVAYNHTEQMLFAADIKVVLWDEMQGEGFLGDAGRQRAYGFSLGGEYIPAPALLAPQYWEKIRFRGGFRFDQLPENADREWAVTAGAGFPLTANGLIDAVLEYGRRTSDSYDNYTEEFVRFSVGINAGRKWARSRAANRY